MLARWIHPKALALTALAVMAANLAHPELLHYIHAAVYFLSGLLCLEVARDYDHRLMRLAWLLISGEAFSLSLPLPLGMPAVTSWVGLARQHQIGFVLVQLGLSSLIAGMLLMWWQLRRFGLGFHVLRRDWLAVGLILLAMTVFFGLSIQGGWISPLMAVARVLLFLAAAVSVLLNRFCRQMGGGEIARVIRFIIAYVATRCLMNMIFAVNESWAPVAREFEAVLKVVFPWIFLFGVYLRARVAVRAQAELARAVAANREAGGAHLGMDRSV